MIVRSYAPQKHHVRTTEQRLRRKLALQAMQLAAYQAHIRKLEQRLAQHERIDETCKALGC